MNFSLEQNYVIEATIKKFLLDKKLTHNYILLRGSILCLSLFEQGLPNGWVTIFERYPPVIFYELKVLQ